LEVFALSMLDTTTAAPPGAAPELTLAGMNDTGEPDGTPQNEQPRKGLGFTPGDWTLAAVGGLLAAGVSGIGLASSYRALERKAAAAPDKGGWGWESPWMLPVGLDLSILAFSIINLILIKADRPLAWVKWVPRLGAVATIYLNWQSAAAGPSQFGHAALVALWVVFSEIAAHLYAAHIDAIKVRPTMERIRFIRWIFKPVSSFRVNRLMKSWEITSYEVGLEQDRQRMVYRSGLRKEYGRLWRFKASEDALQPLRLAAYGMTIEQALEEPMRQEVAEELRVQKRDLQRARARLQAVEAESEVKAAQLAAQAAQIRAAADLEAAKAEADALASVRLQQSEAALQVQQAQAEAEIQRVAAEAAAKVKELEAAEVARQDELARKREKDQLTWESERAALVAQQRETERLQEALARQRETEAQVMESAEAAAARRQLAEDDAAAAQAEKDAAETRRLAAEADLKAGEALRKQAQAEADAQALTRQAGQDWEAAAAARVKAAADELKAAEIEAEARLNPVERDARKVADLIRTEGLAAVTLTRIEAMFGVSGATASGRRKRAIQILQDAGELPAEAA
jgi:hypothetical protein